MNIEIENHSNGRQLRLKTISQREVKADLVPAYRNQITLEPSETKNL